MRATMTTKSPVIKRAGIKMFKIITTLALMTLSGCSTISGSTNIVDSEPKQIRARVDKQIADAGGLAVLIRQAQREIDAANADWASYQKSVEERRLATIKSKRAQGYTVCENFGSYTACK